MKYIIFLFFTLCFPFSLKADLTDIPKRDLYEIKSLFERFIIAYDFGYTIFGSKPMSLAQMHLEIPPNLPLHKHLKAKFLLAKSEKRINAWYKNREEFHFKDFIFLDKKEDESNSFEFALINKKNMLEILRQHALLFKLELGNSFSPESFLEKLEKGELSLEEATNNSHKLLGIMLGYGERNSSLFQERCRLLRAMSKRTKENLPADFELSAQLNIIETQLGDFNEFEEAVIPPLYFLADVSDPETIELKKKYNQDRKAITQMKKRPDFMNCVLKRLTE